MDFGAIPDSVVPASVGTARHDIIVQAMEKLGNKAATAVGNML